MNWKRYSSQSPSLNLDNSSGIHCHVGRWRNDGPYRGNWVILIGEERIFLDGDKPEAEVLREAERLIAARLLVLLAELNNGLEIAGPDE